jgi:hypothetical protein
MASEGPVTFDKQFARFAATDDETADYYVVSSVDVTSGRKIPQARRRGGLQIINCRLADAAIISADDGRVTARLQGGAPENADEMKPGGLESEGGVIDRLGQSLDRPIKIRSRRIREEKMIKPSGISPPAPDERIAPDQRRIGPDKAVA